MRPEATSSLTRSTSGTAGITLERLTLYTPNQDIRICEALDLTVEPGQSLLIVGPSGCGKSSLLRAISGGCSIVAGCGSDHTQPACLPALPVSCRGCIQSKGTRSSLTRDLLAALSRCRFLLADSQRQLRCSKLGTRNSARSSHEMHTAMYIGLWSSANGRIITPASSSVFFLPQKPFMPLGTLRQQLIFPSGVFCTAGFTICAGPYEAHSLCGRMHAHAASA